MEHVPLKKGTHRKGNKTYSPFWSQKFFHVNMNVWRLSILSSNPGYLYKNTHLGNAMIYIRNNRIKHNLPASEDLESIIDSFIVSQDYAFATE